MGTPCSWKAYVGDSTTLKVTVKSPDHPIAQGVKEFTIEHNERYSDSLRRAEAGGGGGSKAWPP